MESKCCYKKIKISDLTNECSNAEWRSLSIWRPWWILTFSFLLHTKTQIMIFFSLKLWLMAFFLIPFFLFYFYLYFIMISNIYINFIVHCTCNTVTLITINNFQNIALYSTKYKEKVKYSSKLQTCWLMSNNKGHNFGCWFCCWLSGLTGK